MSRRPPRSSAAQTRERLITAVKVLLRDRSPSAISVRDVAHAAGVNHGLIHRLFGSKERLVRAGVAALSAELHAQHPHTLGRMTATFDYLAAHPEVARLAARACLEKRRDLLAAAAPPKEALDEILARARPLLMQSPAAGMIDIEVVNALLSSALLAWSLFRPLLDNGFRLPADADDQLRRVLALLDMLLAQA